MTGVLPKRTNPRTGNQLPVVNMSGCRCLSYHTYVYGAWPSCLSAPKQLSAALCRHDRRRTASFGGGAVVQVSVHRHPRRARNMPFALIDAAPQSGRSFRKRAPAARKPSRPGKIAQATDDCDPKPHVPTGMRSQRGNVAENGSSLPGLQHHSTNIRSAYSAEAVSSRSGGRVN
jgi:hypothetical protein